MTTTTTSAPLARPLPPVLGRLLSGTFWLALRTPLQALFAFWSVPLIIAAIGDGYGAYGFAWGFGFLQFLLEFGMSSALQRQVSETWTRGDRAGVDRAIASGLAFYAVMAVLQAGVLIGIARCGVPATFDAESRGLIVRLLWLQALTAPCYGITMVVSSVLQAARRYDFLPKFEMAIVLARFAILWVGLRAGIDFFAIVAAQIVAQVALALGPAVWVMVRELGYVPRFRRVGRADFAPLLHISFYMFLIQLSVVLADKIDTTVLGFALADPAPGIKAYQVVSKPFVQIRQTGGMLAYLVMPAVASLVAARDLKGLERVKYDGPRLHIGLLVPVALLAGIYAAPFLDLWVGAEFPGQVPWLAGLLRLFLVATLPLVLAVPAQAAIGMGRIEVIALAALAGAAINLPLSYALTTRIGVSGVIWGTVLTTLVSNLLVPGVYLVRVLELRPATFLTRTLSAPAAGALALVTVTWALRAVVPAAPRGTDVLARSLPLVLHLGVGCLAYLAGYLAAPAGRSDLAALLRTLRRRFAPG